MNREETVKAYRGISASLAMKVAAVVAFMVLCVTCGSEPVVRSASREKMGGRNSRELIDEALECVAADSLDDRAIGLFTEVANRYYEDQTDTSARRAASEALYHLGNLYMTHDIDYRKAYKSLMTSRQIAEEDGDTYRLAGVYNSLAHLYNYNAVDNADISRAAVAFLQKAAISGVRSGNEEILPSVIVNIALMTIGDRSWGDFADAIRQVRDYGRGMSLSRGYPYDWVRLVTEGMDAYYEGDAETAVRKLQAANLIPDTGRYPERSSYSVNLLLTDIYKDTGQYDKAVKMMHHVLDTAREQGHTDYELAMYAALTNLYESVGETDSVDMYYAEYLKLKAQFEADGGYDKVQTLDFRSEIEKVSRDLEAQSVERQREKRRRLVMLFALIVVSLVCLAILWVYVNLKRNHRNLFERNEEMTRRETQHRMMRERWEAERAELTARLESLESAAGAASATGRSAADEATADDDASGEWLGLFTRILGVMESSRDIYCSGYSLADLAASLGCTTRAVSRAINICHHSNFNTLLNDYRIREVSRLMHEPGAEQLTIESLAESAGFSSRTYFATVFKKNTGLTPSEYFRMAKKR